MDRHRLGFVATPAASRDAPDRAPGRAADARARVDGVVARPG